MFNKESLHEEDRYYIQQLAEQAERGSIDWELTDYCPPSFVSGDNVENTPSRIAQLFSFEAVINGFLYEMDIMETIDIPSGMGDYNLTLIRNNPGDLLKIDAALSFGSNNYECYECAPEEIAERFKDSPIIRLCNAIIPATLEQEDLEEVFTWARFFNETGIPAKMRNHPITKLCEKLFDEHRLLDFHRCVLDVSYRRCLMDELAKA